MQPFKPFHFLLLCWACALVPWTSASGAEAIRETRFDLSTIRERNPKIAAIDDAEGFASPSLVVRPSAESQALAIWKSGDAGDWAGAKYLVVEIFGRAPYSGRISIEFFRKDGLEGAIDLQSGRREKEERPRLLSLQGILPRVPTKLVFPLDHLDAQRIFLPRFPRQLKGTITGSRLDPEEIASVKLRFGPYSEPHFTPVFEIASISLRSEVPEPYPTLNPPVVDKFGQWKSKDWPGKIGTEEELIRRNQQLLESVATARFPESWSQYGGWKAKKFEATGYFHTHHDGRRWWLVDPDGFAFLSAGVTCIGANASGPVAGIEDLFDWLPGGGDPRFAPSVWGAGDKRSVDFLKANLIRAFGDSWEEKWSLTTAGMMRKVRLNTVANWSDIGFARARKLPYVLQMRSFPTTENLLFRDFPDVFSEKYAKSAVEFARQLEPYKEDRHLIGYFLLNEPHWGFGYHNLAFEMFATPAPSATKTAFVAWLRTKYRDDLAAFNNEWNLKLESLDQLASQTFSKPPSEAAGKTFHEFSQVMVKKYVDVVCDEVEKIAPNHLNLGMRYAWISSDLMYNAGERFDVFSINGYGNPGPPETKEITRRSGKPVMIGEWHFGATDRGLPATGIQGALNQKQRAQAYRYYAEQAFTRPELVGIHYFQWNDQPVCGRGDGENYNIGVVDITNQPYPELSEAMATTHARMYPIAAGEEKPYDEVIERVPSIHY